MDDFPEKETPRFWAAVSVFVAALTLVVIMLVYTSTQAHAQQQMCAPVDAVTSGFAEHYNEHPFWQAKSEKGVRLLILQSPDGKTYSLFQVNEQGIACLIDDGKNATIAPPPETGDGA